MMKVNSIRWQETGTNAENYVLDDQPGFLLRIARRRHTVIFAKHMIEDLTGPQFSTLAKLREVAGPVSQNYLGRLIYFDSATMKGVVDRLLSRGLIEIADDPSDKRRRAIMLTKKGHQVVERATVAVRQASQEHFSPLTDGERKTLVKLLKKII
jgi:MarR family transcriptional regulator, lower aerobic nicotinate degradation pathway regulator